MFKFHSLSERLWFSDFPRIRLDRSNQVSTDGGVEKECEQKKTICKNPH